MALKDAPPSILFAVPSTLGDQCCELGIWLMQQGFWMGKHRAVSLFQHAILRSSRILLNRNNFAEFAIQGGIDYLLMADPDMVPDYYCTQAINYEGDPHPLHPPQLPSQKPFLEFALREHFKRFPFSILGAPACGEPPKRQLNVYPLPAREGEKAFPATHEYAATRVQQGYCEQVAAIGTGLIMIPTVVFSQLKRPFFDDVYDQDKTVLEKSQDVYFTNCAHQAGIEVFCAWGSYAGHKKHGTLGCPGIDDVAPKAEPKEPGWTPPVTLQ